MRTLEEHLARFKLRVTEEKRKMKDKAEKMDLRILEDSMIEAVRLKPRAPAPDIVYHSSTGREWGRGVVHLLALPSCGYCAGLGGVKNRRVKTIDGALVYQVCKCVYRGVFRKCLSRYMGVMESQTFGRSTVQFEGTRYARNEENYAGDFVLVSRRHLASREQKVFDLHVLQGIPWGRCCRLIKGLDRGEFFHALYRLEAALGQIFYELQPCALYPLRDYFGVRAGAPASNPEEQRRAWTKPKQIAA